MALLQISNNMEFKDETAYLEALEACRKYALLQSNAVEAWIDSEVSVETLTSVINTSYSIEYATTRLSEMTGIAEPLIKEIVRLPLDELSPEYFQNRLDYYSQAAEVLEML